MLAGIVVSLAAGLASFVLLYRLAEGQLGADGARRAVLYLALFPMALFLQAVYSESLYLLLTRRRVPAAERRRFLGAGLACGLALLTRPVAVALLPGARALRVALARPPEEPRPASRSHRSCSPRIRSCSGSSEAIPGRSSTPRASGRASSRRSGRSAGIWDGLRAGWAGVRQLASGSHTHSYWPEVQGTDPMRVAVVNLECLAALVLFALLTVVAWRRFGAPYGLFSALSLAIPLSMPSDRWPLLSLPRFGLGDLPALPRPGLDRRNRSRAHRDRVESARSSSAWRSSQWALWQWVA